MHSLFSGAPFAVASGFAAAVLLTAANFIANHRLKRIPPRVAYTVLVVFLAGTVVPAFALRALSLAHFLRVAALGFAAAPFAAALFLGGGFLLSAMRGEPVEQWRRLPKLLVALFAPSLAEVLVFVGIVFGVVDTLATPWCGPVLAAMLATVATSTTFGLYHLTHAAPWNTGPVVRILLVVWLFIGGFYAVTGNLWAAALLNTLMAAVGFVKNRVTRPEAQSFAISLSLDALAIGSVLWICASRP